MGWQTGDMTENENAKASTVAGVIEAATAFVKEVPVYQDGAQRGTQAIGDGLGSWLEHKMLPLVKLGYDAKLQRARFEHDFRKKLEAIPEERRQLPDPMVLGPSLDAMAYRIHEDELRRIFVNLLASASDSENYQSVHPSFPETIKNMSPEDAVLLKYLGGEDAPIVRLRMANLDGFGFMVSNHITAFSGFEELDSATSSIDNLARLGLYEVSYREIYREESNYLPIFEKIKHKHDLAISSWKDASETNAIPSGLKANDSSISPEKYYYFMEKGVLNITSYGKRFFHTCIE